MLILLIGPTMLLITKDDLAESHDVIENKRHFCEGHDVIEGMMG